MNNEHILWHSVACCGVVQNPVVYVYIFLFSLTGYLGVNVVLNLVKIYGALIAVTGMSCCYSASSLPFFIDIVFFQHNANVHLKNLSWLSECWQCVLLYKCISLLANYSVCWIHSVSKSHTIFDHSYNKHWSNFIRIGRHIRLSKLINLIDNNPPHLIISEHHFGNLTASYNWRWPESKTSEPWCFSLYPVLWTSSGIFFLVD